MTFDRLESFGTVESTMDIARERALSGDASGVAILAEFQTQGRGRQGRAWFAPPGANVMLTAVGAPVTASDAWQVALLAAVATAEGVTRATGVSVGVRFPNDLWLVGAKLGGILVETVASPSNATVGQVTPLIGIGVNVNSAEHDFPPELRDRATSLRRVAGREFAVGAIAGFILGRMGELYDEWSAGNPLEATILPRWRALADPDARRNFRFDGVETRCRVVDIAGDGIVTLETDDGTRRTIHAAQVILGDD